MSYFEWKPYVPVAARRAKAEREMRKLAKQGQAVSPVRIEGRTIARTFWGHAWCENLERYSDYANRLPRGRTYVRNGSVVDLQIVPGMIQARVSGSEIYRVNITIAPLPKAKWKTLCADCAGAIDSLVELLQGRFSKAVMERICREGTGLFPAPAEIGLDCSCPDWADMCKHVAAVLYGVGARLDDEPELLFLLRGVDGKELLAHAASDLPLHKPAGGAQVLESEDLADLFGLEMAGEELATKQEARKVRGKAKEKPKPVVKTAGKAQVQGKVKGTPVRKAAPKSAPRTASASRKKPRTKTSFKRSGTIS
ncbi:MAG: SWIM zinc finger family protein [Holophaga sp.]|nr:SWIM zinc finger family protein [Holophaga sp.]